MILLKVLISLVKIRARIDDFLSAQKIDLFPRKISQPFLDLLLDFTMKQIVIQSEFEIPNTYQMQYNMLDSDIFLSRLHLFAPYLTLTLTLFNRCFTALGLWLYIHRV